MMVFVTTMRFRDVLGSQYKTEITQIATYLVERGVAVISSSKSLEHIIKF